MIWLTWRQHRAQLLATVVLVGGFCAFLVARGAAVHHLYDTSGLASCLAGDGLCAEQLRTFNDRFHSLQLLIPLVLVLPLLVGLFWGAPLVARETEHGTHRLVWTQGVSRTRWLAVKLGLVAGAAVAVAAGYAWVSTWFAEPFNRASASRLEPGVFDLQGAVPVVYTLFALALGVAVGAMVKRVVPAMATTLAGYAVVRGVVALVLRPHYLGTSTQSYRSLPGNPRMGLGDWVVSTRIVDSAGRLFSSTGSIDLNPSKVAQFCPSVPLSPTGFPAPGSLQGCLQQLGLRTIETYHPASQFWTMQAIEGALFLVATAACVAVAFWAVRRRG